MSQHRQSNYKSRGRGGGAFERLGVPINRDGGGGGGNFRGGRARGNFRGNNRGGGHQFEHRGGRRGGGGRYQGPRGRFPIRGGRAAGSEMFQSTNRQPERFQQKSWFKVIITRGADYGKEFVLKSLNNYLDRPVWPVLYKDMEDGNSSFFVDEEDIADAIGTASRRISAPSGNQKLNIRVSTAPPPYIQLDAHEMELIKSALQNRYNALEQSFNLSSFSFDPVFQDHPGANLSLQRNNVMMAVVDLIGREEAIADKIRSIDVSENRLRFMDYFACLVPRLPNVTKLVLHHNQIDNLNELEKMSGWNILELNLDHTPLCGRYTSKTSYTRDVRGIFKNLMKLDGSDLPANTESKFGLDAETSVVTSLPAYKPSFYVDDNIRGLTVQFITLYFRIFDDDERKNRQRLLEAYDDDATFTMSAINLSFESNNVRGESWIGITRDSHNIMKQEIWERYRAKLVHKSKLAILNYLCNTFPLTSHVAESFVIDISFAMGNVLCVNVNGVFREKVLDNPSQAELMPLRVFNRVFVLIQNERGLCIVNEMLFISTMSTNEYIVYQKQVDRASQPVASPESMGALQSMELMGYNPATASTSDMNTATVSVGQGSVMMTPEMKLERFMRESGMKADWARKCLEDYEFDYDKASAAFAQLRSQIPPEAFQ